MSELSKVMIKVLDPEEDQAVWKHICYLSKELYLEFLDKKSISRAELADYMSLWVLQDFRISLTLTTSGELYILKALIKDRYRSIYPHLYQDTRIDRQGWIRLWLTDHMRKELMKP